MLPLLLLLPLRSNAAGVDEWVAIIAARCDAHASLRNLSAMATCADANDESSVIEYYLSIELQEASKTPKA